MDTPLNMLSDNEEELNSYLDKRESLKEIIDQRGGLEEVMTAANYRHEIVHYNDRRKNPRSIIEENPADHLSKIIYISDMVIDGEDYEFSLLHDKNYGPIDHNQFFLKGIFAYLRTFRRIEDEKWPHYLDQASKIKSRCR